MNADLDAMTIRAVSYVVLDFETVTQPGYPPEPVELGALRIVPPGQLDAGFEVDWLIRPPSHIPLHLLVTTHGIQVEAIEEQPAIAEILAAFDRYFAHSAAIVVAHNAPYDASFILRHADACPHLLQMPFIDTLRLAKDMLPTLPGYGLDVLAGHFGLPIPHNRHRALPDVHLTCQVFLALLSLWQERHSDWSVYQLRLAAGINTAIKPSQLCLFD